MHERVVFQVQCPLNQGDLLAERFSGHWMLALGIPASPQLAVAPVSRQAHCPVGKWRTPSSLAQE